MFSLILYKLNGSSIRACCPTAGPGLSDRWLLCSKLFVLCPAPFLHPSPPFLVCQIALRVPAKAAFFVGLMVHCARHPRPANTKVGCCTCSPPPPLPFPAPNKPVRLSDWMQRRIAESSRAERPPDNLTTRSRNLLSALFLTGNKHSRSHITRAQAFSPQPDLHPPSPLTSQYVMCNYRQQLWKGGAGQGGAFTQPPREVAHCRRQRVQVLHFLSHPQHTIPQHPHPSPPNINGGKFQWDEWGPNLGSMGCGCGLRSLSCLHCPRLDFTSLYKCTHTSRCPVQSRSCLCWHK